MAWPRSSEPARCSSEAPSGSVTKGAASMSSASARAAVDLAVPRGDRKSTRLNSSHSQISYAVFCLKKKKVALLLVVLVLVGLAVVGGVLPITIETYPLAFLCIPILVWTAFRFGLRETATAMLLLFGIAIWGTLTGFGPFAR